MMKFKDYFSRKELFYLGIDCEKEINGLSKDFSGEKKYDDIDLEMKSIYNFIKASQKQVSLNENAMKTSNDILNNNVSKRIVSAFYDVGILNEQDLERFPLDYKLDEVTKTQITVMEAIDEEKVEYEEIETKSLSKEKEL